METFNHGLFLIKVNTNLLRYRVIKNHIVSKVIRFFSDSFYSKNILQEVHMVTIGDETGFLYLLGFSHLEIRAVYFIPVVSLTGFVLNHKLVDYSDTFHLESGVSAKTILNELKLSKLYAELKIKNDDGFNEYSIITNWDDFYNSSNVYYRVIGKKFRNKIKKGDTGGLTQKGFFNIDSGNFENYYFTLYSDLNYKFKKGFNLSYRQFTI